jgi:hypothetical protein
LCSSPNGNYLASVDLDKKLKIWRISEYASSNKSYSNSSDSFDESIEADAVLKLAKKYYLGYIINYKILNKKTN